MAESYRAAEERAGFVLPGDIVEEIILCLPTRSILCFRAACKLWRRHALDCSVLLTHHLRQPALPLFSSQRNVDDEGEDSFLMALRYYCLEAVDLSVVLPRRMVVRFKDVERIDFNPCAVHGSCDGLLLLSYLDRHFVCNSATRQWARLPPLPPDECCIAGFYAHAASKEYRVLYLRRGDDFAWEYYVPTVGSQQQERCIGRRASSDSLADVLAKGGPEHSATMPPVLLHGSLHWPPQQLQDSIRVFDIDAESFRRMRRPDSKYSRCFLFAMKDGKLALSSWQCILNQDPWTVNLWIMQNYKNEAWVFTYKIRVPVDSHLGKGIPLNVTVVSEDGDMLVERKAIVLHYNKNGILLQTLNCNGHFVCFTGHFLKEALLSVPFSASSRIMIPRDRLSSRGCRSLSELTPCQFHGSALPHAFRKNSISVCYIACLQGSVSCNCVVLLQ